MLKLDFKNNALTTFLKSISSLFNSATGLINGLKKAGDVFQKGLKPKKAVSSKQISKTVKESGAIDSAGLKILLFISSFVMILLSCISLFFYFTSRITPKKNYLSITK